MPPGFVLDGVSGEAPLSSAQAPISLRWHNAAGQAIYLATRPEADPLGNDQPIAVGPGGALAVQINGTPGMLIGGMWNGQTRQWDQQATHFHLNWLHNGRFYSLDLHTDGCDIEAESCRNPAGPRATLTSDDVLRIAESIR